MSTARIAAIALSGALCFGANKSVGTASMEEISLAVEEQLSRDAGVAAHAIDVEGKDGIVTLEGTVDNILAKEQAASTAASVAGVRGVVNLLRVKPISRADGDLRTAIETALSMDPVADEYEIDVAVQDGVVTLKGTADSFQEKMFAGRIVKSVAGVKDLKNEISVVARSLRSDAEIQPEIERRLRWDRRIDDGLIDVQVEDGKVTLRGTVGSAAEKARAASAAWVSGAVAVDDSGLNVQPGVDRDRLRGDKYGSRKDSNIEQAVRSSLQIDPRIHASQAEIRVNDGVVTLSGVVGNLRARKAAAQTAENIVGVWKVRNHLKVRPAQHPEDEILTRRIQNRLTLDPYVDRHDVMVVVRNGKAHLYGSVDSAFERRRAEEVVSGIDGVLDVDTHLTVHSPTNILAYYDDWEIKTQIESELRWSPFVDGGGVMVQVEQGVATLSGTVDTWAERTAAAENAFEGGAIAVNNKLKVENGPDGYRP